MAEQRGKEKGTRWPRQLRTGIDTPYWRGLDRDADPGAIADNELQDAINVRLIGGRIDCRGGQEKLTESALDGCVWSIDDLPMPTVGLFIAHSDGADFTLDRYNLDLSPNYQGVYPVASVPNIGTHQPFGSPSEPRRILTVWRNKLLAGSNAANAVYEVVLPKEGEIGDISLRPLFGATTVQVSSFAVVPEGREDILYIGSTTNNEVLRYDGTWLSTDGAIGLNSERMILGRFHDLLHIFGTQYAKVRQPGAPLVNGLPAPGTYASIAMPGTVTNFRPSAMCEFGDELIIAGLDTAIIPSLGNPGPGCLLKYDGSTLTLAHQPNDGGAPYEPARGVSDVFLWNGKVWYVWRAFGPDTTAWIGNYDGSTWNDTVGSLGIVQSSPANTGDIVTANGILYATTIRDDGLGATNESVLMSSPDGVAWTVVYNITANESGGQVTIPGNLVVFG